MQEKEGGALTGSRGLRSVELNSCGRVRKQATKEQFDRRNVERKHVDAGYQPRRIHFSEAEVYYMTMKGGSGMRWVVFT